MAGDAVAQFRLQISWSSEYINSTYNAPGVQSPVIDSLINQIIAAQGNKEKLLPLGASTGSRINVELLHAANVVHGGKTVSPGGINSPNPLYALFTAWVSIPGGMTLIKRPNCRQPDNRESRWALI
ncbi:ABC transporter substrate-binding protein [Escherichia coli]|uniref:ABC transporter substrate-binding protein n=1 Tax=Escherichia coli TaxID=562 RepID=A0A376KQS6_ECOLX|nr:ABC transporter substrate-binding protein [Escherichia coli]